MAEHDLALFTHVNTASDAAADIIELVLDRAVGILYDKYLATKELDFLVGRVLNDISVIVNARLPLLDVLMDRHRPSEARPVRHNAEDLTILNTIGAWQLEAAPTACLIDTWAQNSVPTRRPKVPTLVSPGSTVGASTSGVKRRQSGSITSRSTLSESGKIVNSDGQNQMTSSPRSTGSRQRISPRDTLGGNLQNGSSRGTSGPPSVVSTSVPTSSQSTKLSSNTAPRRTGPGTSDQGTLQPPSRSSHTLRSSASVSANTQGDKRVDTAVSRAKPMDPAKRQALQAKTFAGKQITVDERGNVLVVNAPDPAKVPALEIPMSVLVEGAPRALGSSVISALKTQALSQIKAAPVEKQSVPILSKPTTRRASSIGSSHATSARQTTDPHQFFIQQPGVQPSLVETLHATGQIAPGVTVVEPGGKTLTGPSLLGGTTHTEYTRTIRSSNTTAAASRTHKLTGELQKSHAAAMAEAARDTTAIGITSESTEPARQTRGDGAVLDKYPDVINRASTLRNAGAMTIRTGMVVSPKPGSGVDFKAKVELRKTVTHKQQHDALGTSSSSIGIVAPNRSAEPSPPRTEPLVGTEKQRHHTVGDIARRPRDRASVLAATVPKEHLPAPMFPAVSRHVGPQASIVSHASAGTEEDMLVVDGSLNDEFSNDVDGPVMPARMAALTPSPAGSPHQSRSPSPQVVPKAAPKAWGASANRTRGGSIRIEAGARR